MERKGIFEGIKIIDLSWGAAGPLVPREMAAHGATVIRVESHRRVDFSRPGSPFKDNKPGINRSATPANFSAGKYGMSLDLGKPKGQEIAIELVKWADIFIESFVPGTIKRMGLDYETVSKVKPDIIYISTSQMGSNGPYSLFAGLGWQATALAGFSWLTGWPDRGPAMLYGPYTDFIAPWYMLAALTAALLHRRRTGKGMYLEQSQLEAAAAFLSPAILDYVVNGREAGRLGNRHPEAAPHGVYRCQGEDRWAAIAVYTDEEWKDFCRVIGYPEWTKSPRFSTLKGRKENEDELDRLIEEWTIDRTAEEVMRIMQAVGVSAGILESSKDLFEDPQLKHRNSFVTLNHTEIGPHAYRMPAYRLSKSPVELKMPGPCLGEHNEYVYKEILGFSDDEIADLLAEGVITTEADLPHG